MSRDSIPGFAGTGGVVLAVLGVSAVITVVTGAVAHWPLVLAGICVGLWVANHY